MSQCLICCPEPFLALSFTSRNCFSLSSFAVHLIRSSNLQQILTQNQSYISLSIHPSIYGCTCTLCYKMPFLPYTCICLCGASSCGTDDKNSENQKLEQLELLQILLGRQQTNRVDFSSKISYQDHLFDFLFCYVENLHHNTLYLMTCSLVHAKSQCNFLHFSSPHQHSLRSLIWSSPKN